MDDVVLKSEQFGLQALASHGGVGIVHRHLPASTGISSQKSNRLLLCCITSLGILAFRLSAWSIFGNSFASSAADAFTCSRLAQLATIILVIILVALKPLSSKIMRYAVIVAMVSMLAGCISIMGIDDPADPLFVLGRVVHGFGAAMLLLGWGTRTSSISPSLSSLSITGAFALYGILITVLEGASPVVMGGIAVASPIICGGLLLLPTECTIYDGNWKRITAKHLTSPPWGVLCLLLLCSIACAATEVVVAPSQEASRLFTSNALRLPVFLLVFVVNFLWAIPLSHDNPDQLWGLYSCLIFCGLLGYSSFCFIDLPTSVSFMNATQDCLMIFAWTFVSGLAYRESLPKTMTFGIGAVLFMQANIPSGILHLLFPVMSHGASRTFAAALSFCMAILLIGYTFFLVLQRPQKSTAHKDEFVTQSEKHDTDDFAWLAASFGLSGRETEVVKLLCRGYTLPQIGERLTVSLNTVRSHTKSIYTKLGIHSKSELIQLIEKKDGSSPRTDAPLNPKRPNRHR